MGENRGPKYRPLHQGNIEQFTLCSVGIKWNQLLNICPVHSLSKGVVP